MGGISHKMRIILNFIFSQYSIKLRNTLNQHQRSIGNYKYRVYLYLMDNFRNSYFNNKNGADELSVTLVVAGVILLVAYPFFTNKIVQACFVIAALLCLFFGIWRSFSKNIGKRRTENQAFVSFFKSESKEEKEAKRKLKEENRAREEQRKAQRKEEEKVYAFFRCPKCNKELRVPKGKGKIKITCPNCSEQFIRKT